MNEDLIKRIEYYYKNRYGTMNGFQHQLGEIIEFIKEYEVVKNKED